MLIHLHQQCRYSRPYARLQAPRNQARRKLPKLESECKAGVTPQSKGQVGKLLQLALQGSSNWPVGSSHLCLCLQKTHWRPGTWRAPRTQLRDPDPHRPPRPLRLASGAWQGRERFSFQQRERGAGEKEGSRGGAELGDRQLGLPGLPAAWNASSPWLPRGPFISCGADAAPAPSRSLGRRSWPPASGGMVAD